MTRPGPKTNFELLETNQTIIADFYSEQLQSVHEALIRKRRISGTRHNVILLHDNGRPHVPQFGWEFLEHPPYSPDLAPSDYHLFQALRNHLCDKQYEDFDKIQFDLTAFFESWPANFYKCGIERLPTRWTKVVETDGDYIVD